MGLEMGMGPEMGRLRFFRFFMCVCTNVRNVYNTLVPVFKTRFFGENLPPRVLLQREVGT